MPSLLHGAVAKITGKSQDDDTLAIMVCEDLSFPEVFMMQCVKSSINVQQAHAYLRSTSSHGYSKNPFKTNAVFHCMTTIHCTAEKIIAGESNSYNEIVFSGPHTYLLCPSVMAQGHQCSDSNTPHHVCIRSFA